MILGANDLGGFSVSVVVCCFDLFDWQLLPSYYFLSKMTAKNKRTKKNKGIKKNNSNKKDVDFDP